MAKFDKERFGPDYQSLVGIKAPKKLHENSIELVNILEENSVTLNSVFELGSGPGRNLHYILEKFPDAKFYCSDLFEHSSLNSMSEELRNVVKFIEGDSEDVIKSPIEDLSLFISSDHLMHLNYPKADFIIDQINSIWKPNYILLREVTKEYETPEHPRLFHDYDKFLKFYDKVYEKQSDQDKAYFIWLLKRK